MVHWRETPCGFSALRWWSTACRKGSLPGGAFGDYGDPSVAFAVGGVTLFLEYAKEVVAFEFPSTIYVYGVVGW